MPSRFSRRRFSWPWRSKDVAAHRRQVAPSAAFVVGKAERLPFAPASFDLVTAAGAINYTDLDVSFPEVARILTGDGCFVIYDFSAGRRFADRRHLASSGTRNSTGAIRKRLAIISTSSVFPTRSGASRSMPAFRAFEVSVPMTADSYLRYAMSETRVGLAIGQVRHRKPTFSTGADIPSLTCSALPGTMSCSTRIRRT